MSHPCSRNVSALYCHVEHHSFLRTLVASRKLVTALNAAVCTYVLQNNTTRLCCCNQWSIRCTILNLCVSCKCCVQRLLLEGGGCLCHLAGAAHQLSTGHQVCIQTDRSLYWVKLRCHKMKDCPPTAECKQYSQPCLCYVYRNKICGCSLHIQSQSIVDFFCIKPIMSMIAK